MSSLSRYRKTGGFLQLLSLIETFGPAKRTKFLEMIEEESATWAEALRDKMLTPERLATWPVENLVAILKQLPPKSQAYALEGLPKDMKAKIWSALPAVEQRRLTEVLGENKPKADEIASIVTKFIETTRRMILERDLAIDRIEPALAIPSDIESRLDGASPGAVTPAGRGDGGDARQALAHARRENAQLREELARLREKFDQVKKLVA